MDAAFWHDKWERGVTGFHLDHINPYLAAHWHQLKLPAQAPVLVPLCGKSLDLAYLAGEGHPVLGIELNTLAVESLFASLGAVPEPKPDGALRRYQWDEVAVLQGDLFQVMPEQAAHCTAFYDRAALIALPEAMRSRYVAKLAELMKPGAVGLLVTLDYPQESMAGPPFAVSEQEVMARLTPHFEVEPLASHDVLADNPRFVAKGVPWLKEQVYRLVRR
ncbi:thiopurine S-methyltransferase [Ferrimonas balearica]|uniref:thiopurine S-methyltransferase n=1 Tax=Ferrimonas balearica TaxID=44012 RepID=UPI001C9998C0|nr:thiopurine S-methyltransferase [Ferrimonas balearica]MBY5922372.1 thiopurine S-methyltransferase [Ferrimonas balearica]MBY5995356.1 thiopurine S-methyltransferase [Ferrimonas balearica]